jgi:HEAT repeat protein
MPTSNRSRGATLPRSWQYVLIGAAFCGVFWMVWRHVRQQTDLSARQYVASEMDQNVAEADDVSDNPVESLHAVEVFARRGKDAVPRLRTELSATDPKSRSYALLGLATIGPAAADALDQVRALLTDESAPVRANAIIALRSITQNSDEAARSAAQMLADPDEEVREAAASQLLVIGPQATNIVLETLQNDLPAARSRALRVLREWKQPRPFGWPAWRQEVREIVRNRLDDPDPGVRIEAQTAVALFGIAEPAEIRELLQHEDAARAEIALGAIPELTDRAAELLPDVVDVMDRFPVSPYQIAQGSRYSTNSISQHLILSALKAMKTAARPAVPQLMRLFRAEQWDYTRKEITETLIAIGTDTDDLVGLLAPLLLDEDRGVARQAGQFLAKVSPEAARDEVSKMLPKLGSGDNVNKTVLYALNALGREAREAAPQVAPLVKNSDPWVSQFAKHVLNNIGLDAAAEAPAGR